MIRMNPDSRPAAEPRPRRTWMARLTALASWCCVVLLVLLIPLGCSSSEGEGDASDASTSSDDAETLNIVCTIGMVSDIVAQVAGEHATVTHIIGEGVDPHTYRATRRDVQLLQEADVVFYSGLHLEGKMADVLVRVARGGKPVYAVTELLEESVLLEPDGFEGQYDPHVWMDVSGWMSAVDAVALALSEVDVANAASYAGNATAYGRELQELHAWAMEAIESIPPESRVLITAHDAFNYFGRAYGVEVMGIQGISTDSEAGLDDINRLIDLIVDRNVRAVFVESSVARKNVQALIEGAQSRGSELTIGGELYSDAMGAPGTRAGTYIGMIEHNVVTMVRALGGTVPSHDSFGAINLE